MTLKDLILKYEFDTIAMEGGKQQLVCRHLE